MTKGMIDLSRVNTPKLPTSEPASEAANTNRPTKAEEQPQKAPAPAPSDKVSTLGARIPADLHQKIKLYCVAEGVEMQKFVQEALEKHLDRLLKSKK